MVEQVLPAMPGERSAWSLLLAATAPHPRALHLPVVGGEQLDEPCSRDFLALAFRHRLPGLAMAGLAELDVRLAPSAAAELRTAALRDAVMVTRLTARMFALLDAFAAAGIPARVLKGPPVAALAYAGGAGLRHLRDIDLLVPERWFEPAHRIILGQGFRTLLDIGRLTVAELPRFAHELPYVDEAGCIVELHAARSAHGRGGGQADGFDGDAGSTLPVTGREVPVDPPAEIFVHLCRHGASHAWTLLKWLADISHLIAAAPDVLDWDAIAARTRRSASQRHVGLALALARDLHGVTPPAALAEFIDTLPPGLAQGLAAGLSDPDKGGPTPIQMARLEVVLASGLGAKAAAIRDFVFAPTIQDARDWPLPRGLLWAARPALYVLRRRRAPA